MMLAAKIDEYGKAGWIAATVLGFILWWPVGLAMLLFMGCSGRWRRGWHGDGPGRWYNTAHQSGLQSGGGGWGGFGRRGRWGGGGGGPSGNQAFDDYRTETLRRLE